MEGWALFFILAVILLLVILLVNLLKQDSDDATPPVSGGYTPASVSPPPVTTKRAPAKPTADEQSYYQFSSPALRQCAFCGCENETGAAQCQVCGKSL